MSSPNRRLILSPRAEDDFTDILQYTLQTWGEAQMLSYRAVVNDGLQLLLANPKAGFVKPELSEQHRLLVVGEHVIVYRERGPAIEVSRILHGRRHMKDHLR